MHMRKRKIIYFISLISVMILNLLYRDYQPFIILMLLIILPGLLLLYIAVMRKFLTITLKTDESEAIRGDRPAFEVRIGNKSTLTATNIVIDMKFTYSNCEDEMERQFVLNAKGVDITKITGKMVLNYCGSLQVTISKAYIYDALKLFKLRIPCNDCASILIMPMLVEPDLYTLYTPANSIFDTQNYSNKTPGDDPSEIFDTREYHEGDNINRVHWKISAKEESLFVKEFSFPISRSNVILLELFQCETQEERKNLDGVYEMAYAIGNFACMREKEFYIAYYCAEDKDLKMIWINSHEMLLEALGLIIQEKTYDKVAHALQAFQMDEIMNCERLYYITSELTGEVITFLDDAKDGKAFVYCMEGSIEESDSMETDGAMLIRVDRNDIKQGLNTVMV